MPARVGKEPIVIVGGGLAGGNAVVTLREEGFDGRIVLVSGEDGIPFGRPPLSKTYLRSECYPWWVRPADWYSDHGVELLTGSSVTVVDAAARRVTLDSGQGLGYRQLLIATGGESAARSPWRGAARHPLPAHDRGV